MDLHTIEICAGVGMLGEGLRAGFDYMGITHRTVAYLEREAYAASVLVARMEDESLDDAPVWSDLLTFDGAAWRGAVDCIAAGFPCQDLSLAGKRAGLDGARSGLFFNILDIADDCGARYLFLENVAGIASATASVVDEAEGALEERAAARVLGELADRGWNAEWITLSASDVGASHGRARWFCWVWRVAHADLPGRETVRPCAIGQRPGHEAQFQCGNVAHAGHQSGSRPIGKQSIESGQPANCSSGGKLAHTSSPRQQGVELCGARTGNRGGQEAHGPTSQLCGLFAPGPADSRWPGILASQPWLAPALSKEAESVLCGTPDGLASGLDFGHRAQRLKCVGNGVVALQASVAVVQLLRRAGFVKTNNARQAVREEIKEAA